MVRQQAYQWHSKPAGGPSTRAHRTLLGKGRWSLYTEQRLEWKGGRWWTVWAGC